jgi:hypothetical protein
VRSAARAWRYSLGVSTKRQTDPNTTDGLRMQIEHIDGLSSGDSEWPHMEPKGARLLGRGRVLFHSAYFPKTPQNAAGDAQNTDKLLKSLVRPTGIEPVFPP